MTSIMSAEKLRVAAKPIIKHPLTALLQHPRQPSTIAEFALAHALALGFADAAALVLISDECDDFVDIGICGFGDPFAATKAG